jgi:cysteinyl-tRNA synthetase
MGEVYRALDTRLHREVAVKVLPNALAGDPDRTARLQREAQILAALNHPHIATIHGFEIAGTLRAIIMELIEGPTLADRLARGPVPLDEALEIARDGFRAAMDDDLNVSGALGSLFELVRDLNKRIDARSLSTADARRAAAAIRNFDRVLAVLDDPQALPDGAQPLLDERAAARERRDFAASDRLRDELASMGVVVEDTRDGQRWHLGGKQPDG